MAAMPTVPKIIIRGIPRPQPPKQQRSSLSAPDLSNASRVPNAPVHHMSPTKFSDDQSDRSSDSDSDSNLHISQPSRSNFGTISNLDSNKDRVQPQKQQQMPFIRPDHTLLPPKEFSLSPSPPPQPPSAPTSVFMNPHHSQERFASNLLSSMQQQPIFNGNVQYRAKQENAGRNDSLYCYCRRPYDEMSEMIACDAQDCAIEWFHFECVGITVAPQDKWYCPQCRNRNIPNSYTNNVNNTNANALTPAPTLDSA